MLRCAGGPCQQYIIDASGLLPDDSPVVIVTQPRRLAAINVATRVASAGWNRKRPCRGGLETIICGTVLGRVVVATERGKMALGLHLLGRRSRSVAKER